MKILVFFAAYFILFLPLTILNFCLVIAKNGFKTISGYCLDSAYRLDVFGCDEFRTLWNTILITKDGMLFGGKNKSISYSLGENQYYGTLSICGKILAAILDVIDENHCEKTYKK